MDLVGKRAHESRRFPFPVWEQIFVQLEPEPSTRFGTQVWDTWHELGQMSIWSVEEGHG